MKTLNSLVAITLLGAASVAGAQVNIPNPRCLAGPTNPPYASSSPTK